MDNKLKIAILGTGNIGTDLLIKIFRSETLTCTMFAGRNYNSKGMQRARELHVPVSDKGIQSIIDNPDCCDIIIDCTNAQSHAYHWKICQEIGKTLIDMTPASVGFPCIPAILTDTRIFQSTQNINMITCGGQTSVPIAYALNQVHEDIDYIEVASTISSHSAGPATRQNLDEYVETTTDAIKKFTKAKESKAILILNPATPPISMQTTIYARIKNPYLPRIQKSVTGMVETLNNYSPGYQLVVPPVVNGDTVVISVKVEGAGDYLPQYAGNLDIINCAALAVLENIAKFRKKNEQDSDY